jgi:phosphoglycolate phosphatase-like HAD superfamily hydrolase
MPSRKSPGHRPSHALVLFDIDGTLIRRAGPHHRQALVEAVRKVTGLESTTDSIPVQGMLDPDILTIMMKHAGARPGQIRSAMPELIRIAQNVYSRTCPDLQRKVCPGARRVLRALNRRGIPVGLVTGNLTRIAWKKMEQAGLRSYFRFGAFSETAKDRAGLVRRAIREARQEEWIDGSAKISLIGDHPNDIRAARAIGIRAIAVATGIETREVLEAEKPDLLLDDLRSLSLEELVGC